MFALTVGVLSLISAWPGFGFAASLATAIRLLMFSADVSVMTTRPSGRVVVRTPSSARCAMFAAEVSVI